MEAIFNFLRLSLLLLVFAQYLKHFPKNDRQECAKFIEWKLSRNEKVCVGEYALKKKESYWLTQPIIGHGSGSAGYWKIRARKENSRARSCTTAFTLADCRAIQQTRQSIVQCKPSFRFLFLTGLYG